MKVGDIVYKNGEKAYIIEIDKSLKEAAVIFLKVGMYMPVVCKIKDLEIVDEN